MHLFSPTKRKKKLNKNYRREFVAEKKNKRFIVLTIQGESKRRRTENNRNHLWSLQYMLSVAKLILTKLGL